MTILKVAKNTRRFVDRNETNIIIFMNILGTSWTADCVLLPTQPSSDQAN